MDQRVLINGYRINEAYTTLQRKGATRSNEENGAFQLLEWLYGDLSDVDLKLLPSVRAMPARHKRVWPHCAEVSA